MSTCWLHGLYDAILYINTGLGDYVGPAEELIAVLTNALKAADEADGDGKGQLSQQQVDLGNKILVRLKTLIIYEVEKAPTNAPSVGNHIT